MASARFDMVPFEVGIAELDDPDLRVLSFTGQERMSQPYEYSIDLVSTDDGLALEDLIGKKLKLTINSVEGDTQRYVHGVITRFLQAESSTRQTQYRAVIAPQLQLLSYRQDCRIFQDKTVPEIIKEVLKEHGVTDYVMKTNRAYQPRVYCVQYRESDLNFITRLMEDEGILYFFEHLEDKAELAFVDSASTHKALPLGDELVHHDTGGGLSEGDFAFGVRWQESITTNAVVMRDFNFEQPSVEHMHLDKDVDQCTRLEQYDYPGNYMDADLGDSRLCTRLEALQASRQQVTGSTTVRRLMAGFRVTLAEHPNDRFNREYTLTAITHSGSSPQVLEQDQGGASPSYSCQFSAVPSSTVFRPVAIARRPRVDGIQTAIIVGPSGEEIYTDEFGRVKVQFHWDRLGKYDEKSSCWVRVSQLWAGAGWGGMDIPRIGHEVIISFEEGDPDRPMITGRVYHGENRPPHELPTNKVKSTLRSNSTPGGGGFNELTFDDTKDEEEVTLISERNTTISTGNDKSQSTGHDESLSVGNDRTKTVGHDETHVIENDQTRTVLGNRTSTIDKIDAKTINDSREEVIKNNDVKTVSDGDRSVTVEKGDYIMSTSLGEQKIHAKTRVWIDSTEVIELTSGASSITLKKDGTIDINCKVLNVVTSESTTVDGGKSCTLSAKSFSASGTKDATMGTGGQAVKTTTSALETSGAQISSSAIGTHTITGAIVKIN